MRVRATTGQSKSIRATTVVAVHLGTPPMCRNLLRQPSHRASVRMCACACSGWAGLVCIAACSVVCGCGCCPMVVPAARCQVGPPGFRCRLLALRLHRLPAGAFACFYSDCDSPNPTWRRAEGRHTHSAGASCQLLPLPPPCDTLVTRSATSSNTPTARHQHQRERERAYFVQQRQHPPPLPAVQVQGWGQHVARSVTCRSSQVRHNAG